MMKKWNPRTRDGKVAESRLDFGFAEIVVHHYMDEHPDQWMYSCYRLGVERVHLGSPGDTIEAVQRMAIKHLRGVLRKASDDLAATEKELKS